MDVEQQRREGRFLELGERNWMGRNSWARRGWPREVGKEWMVEGGEVRSRVHLRDIDGYFVLVHLLPVQLFHGLAPCHRPQVPAQRQCPEETWAFEWAPT